MKNRILLIAVLFFTLLAHSQKRAGSAIVSTATFFAPEMSTEKWANSNGASFTKANYKHFDGESYALLTVANRITSVLSFEITESKGKLHVAVTGPGGEELFAKSFLSDEEETKQLTLEPGEYRISFTGSGSKGSYFVKWAPL